MTLGRFPKEKAVYEETVLMGRTRLPREPLCFAMCRTLTLRGIQHDHVDT